jgi:hypothetical protein
MPRVNTADDQPSSLSPRIAWACAVACWGIGLAIVGVALGVIPTAPENILAPRWVVGAAGVIFIAGGFAPLANRWGPSLVVSNIVGLGILLPLTLVAHWVAFGPGTRQFSGGFGVGPLVISNGTSELPGRIAFGIGAILLDIFIVALVVRLVRKKARQANEVRRRSA